MLIFDKAKTKNISSRDKDLPSSLSVYTKNEKITPAPGSTVFGVAKGEAVLYADQNEFKLKGSSVFSMTRGHMEVVSGEVIAFSRENFIGANQVTTSLESTGRLQYIDGCSDTLLIAPPRLGDPCLNALYFPEHTIQTFHHHASVRMGYVLSGFGTADLLDQSISLKEGDVFMIPAQLKHRFKTDHQKMMIIAFHPDSDWGPTDEIHPMINKTIISKNVK